METLLVALEQEEELADGDAGLLPVVQEEQGVSRARLHSSGEQVSLDVDLDRDEMVALVVAGRQREEVKLLLLHDQGQRQEQVGKDRNNDHEERAQRQRHAKEDVHDHRPDLGPASSGQQIGDDLLEVLEQESAQLDGLDDGVELI